MILTALGFFTRGIGLKLAMGAAVVGAVLMLLLRTHNAGRQAERVDNLKKASKVQHEQLKAALRRPDTNDDLDRILRDGDF